MQAQMPTPNLDYREERIPNSNLGELYRDQHAAGDAGASGDGRIAQTRSSLIFCRPLRGLISFGLSSRGLAAPSILLRPLRGLSSSRRVLTFSGAS